MLGIDEILRAKAAADVGRDKPHCCRSDAQRAGGIVAGGMDALARDIGAYTGRLPDRRGR